MTKLIARIFFLSSYLPFVHYVIESLYQGQIDRLQKEYKDHPELEDILILNHLPDFVYGRSQYTLLLVTKRTIHPKAFLNTFRSKLSQSLMGRIVFNLSYIPVLSDKEFKLDLLRGFLIRNSLRDTVKWQSVLLKKDTVSYLGKQNEFAIKYSSFQNITHYFLTLNKQIDFEIRVRNIRRSLNNFKRYYPEILPELTKFNELARRLQKFPILKSYYQKSFYKKCWKLLGHSQKMITLSDKSDVLIDSQLNFLKDYLELPFIEDIFVTPSLIQFNPELWQGKMYVDIILSNRFKGHHKKLQTIKQEIKAKNNETLKFRVRFTTPMLFEISGQSSLYPFPLEPLVRAKKGISLKERRYPFLASFEDLTMANIHFLVTQFMRFRSLKQKNDLIGSKFIKSLNLMYRYHLVLEFLEGEEFKLDHRLGEIRNFFTPQLAHLNVDDPVTKEDWLIIESQLKYLLKKIRLKLVIYDDSLYELRF